MIYQEFVSFFERSRDKKTLYFNVIHVISLSVFLIYILKFNFRHSISEYNSVLIPLWCALLAVPLLMKKKLGIGDTRVRFALSAGVAITISYMIYLAGGISAPGSLWLCTIPIVYGLLLGMSWAVFANFAVLVLISFFFYQHQMGFGVNIFDGQVDYISEKFLSTVLFLCFSSFTTIYILWEEKQANLDLQKKHSDSENLLRLLIHDVSNGLSSLDMNLFMARKDTGVHEKFFMNVDRMERVLENVTKLLGQIRKIKAVKDGKEALSLEDSEMHELLREACDKVRALASEKGVDFQVSYGPPGLAVRVERALFCEIILMNILTNALKFTHSGGRVEVSAREERGQVHIQIRDSGVGMPLSILQNLFRIDVPTSRKGTQGERGTGYGMPLVFEYLKMMSGEMEVISHEDSGEGFERGTLVILRLPRARANAWSARA